MLQIGSDLELEGHLVQIAGHGQEHLQLDQVSQSSIQPDFECFIDWKYLKTVPEHHSVFFLHDNTMIEGTAH